MNTDTHTAPARAEIINLLNNGNFAEGLAHWTVDDKGRPANCEVDIGRAVKIKNNASIEQPVVVEAPAPYTLRFFAFANEGGTGKLEIFENGAVAQSWNLQSSPTNHRLSFVTRENTTSLTLRITGTHASPIQLANILFEKDEADSDELVRNGDFLHGSEDWTLSQTAYIANGVAQISGQGAITQTLHGLTVGATYQIKCKTASPTYIGQIAIITSTANQDIIEVVASDTDYSIEHQITEDTVRLQCRGGAVAFDSVSVKKISVR